VNESVFQHIEASRRKASKSAAWNEAELAVKALQNAGYSATIEDLGEGRYPYLDGIEQIAQNKLDTVLIGDGSTDGTPFGAYECVYADDYPYGYKVIAKEGCRLVKCPDALDATYIVVPGWMTDAQAHIVAVVIQQTEGQLDDVEASRMLRDLFMEMRK
jgi:hypothetical protein